MDSTESQNPVGDPNKIQLHSALISLLWASQVSMDDRVLKGLQEIEWMRLGATCKTEMNSKCVKQ